MQEIWKSYKTYGRSWNGGVWEITDLEISNFGNVRGTKWNNEPFEQNMITINSEGRRIIGIKGRIYVLVWEVFNGPVPSGYVVHHIDHNKLNDRLDNLMLMSVSDHFSHHNKGVKKSDKWKESIKKSSKDRSKKLSERMSGKNNPMYGKSATKGTKWWNNGISNKRSVECPGPDYVEGRLIKCQQ
jgi:hypothetical protein